MPAQMLSLSEGPSILLDKPILLFGRHPECDIQLNSRKISRRHCCIAQVGDYLIIRDLGSTNGIRINQQRVFEGKLANGDEVTIGNFRYQICWDGAESAAARRRDEQLTPAAQPIAIPQATTEPRRTPPAPPSTSPGAVLGKPTDSARLRANGILRRLESVKPSVINDDVLEEADEPIALDEWDPSAPPMIAQPANPSSLIKKASLPPIAEMRGLTAASDSVH